MKPNVQHDRRALVEISTANQPEEWIRQPILPELTEAEEELPDAE
ncbi:MAG: hypothetical protein ABF683_01660 [Sporolactobacillus sp.]